MEKKFEQLIDLIINENEEQASELFHEIVVEKSREIYESIMDEETMDGEEEMVGEVGDLMDEIDAEQSGVVEAEDDEEVEDEDEEVFDLDDSESDMDVDSDEGVEDAVVRIEDKLDKLMAEFEEIMADKGEGAEDMEDMEGDEGVEDAEDMEDMEGEEGAEDMEDEEGVEDAEEMMEAIQLQKVSVTHGDDGAQKKSPTTFNSGQAGMDSRPVKFSGDAETVPTSPKAPSNYGTKGETQVKHAGNFKNVPGQRGQDLGKAPAPVKSQASGVNTKSPVAK